MVKKDKKAIAMSFNWIFAIIIGASILFLAIFGAVRFLGTGQQTVNTRAAAQLTSIFDPLETGLASRESNKIFFAKDVKIDFTCEEKDNQPFGRQTIIYSEKSFGKYGKESIPVEIVKDYVFAEDIVEGRELYYFSKPFYMPYKIADLMMLSFENYCIYKSPKEIQQALGQEQENIQYSDDFYNCTEASIKVCFEDKEGCDIKVIGMCSGFDCNSEYDYGMVVKKNKQLYYDGNLLYGAIFSSPDIYECNVKRLIGKFNELGLIYLDKISIIEEKGCSSNIRNELNTMLTVSKTISSSKDIPLLLPYSKSINQANMATKSGCRLYRMNPEEI